MKLVLSAVVTVAALMLAAASMLAAGQAGDSASLKNPASLKEQAPDSYKASFDTSAGAFLVEVHGAWAPLGADRFYNLVKHGFFDQARFFRVIPDFMVQLGINGDPAVTSAWANVILKDDPVKQSNKKGYITYGNTGRPDSRGTQMFINYKDNGFLDSQGFAPFGEVISGMDIVQKLYSEYGTKPQEAQSTISSQGNKFLMAQFPKLDYIKKATIAK